MRAMSRLSFCGVFVLSTRDLKYLSASPKREERCSFCQNRSVVWQHGHPVPSRPCLLTVLVPSYASDRKHFHHSLSRD
ncbi:hypothetical protein BDR22DRAFT_847295 [Usnea florida]